MRSILGIDAAWTDSQPSGVALIQESAGQWRVVCVTPSYESFIEAGRGIPVDWQSRKKGACHPAMADLLEAAQNLGANNVELIALDIPLARSEFDTRRASDSAISKAFGGKGCSTHSPTGGRPGRISRDLMRQLKSEGFSLQTTDPNTTTGRRAIEVYPHPALLTLLERDYRVPYKVSNSSKYWKGESIQHRIGRLLDEFRNIYQALQTTFGTLQFDLPSVADVSSLSSLKRYEDALDALVCAWVGSEHLRRRTRPFGDRDSVIWVP